MDKKAQRIAAMHFFAGCMSDDEVDMIWSWTEMAEDEAEKLLKSNLVVFLWEPFDDCPLSHILEWMKHLRDQIITEMQE